MSSEKYLLKKFIIMLSAAFFIFSLPNFVLAAEKTVDWKVEKVGVLKVPQNWETVKLEEVLAQVEKTLQDTQKKPQTALIPGVNLKNFSEGKEYLDDLLKKENINLYQVTMNSGESYYTSWMMLRRSDKPMTPDESMFFGKEASEGTRLMFAEKIMEVSGEIVEEIAKEFSSGKSKTEAISVKILGQTPTQSLTIQDAPAYSTEFRALIKAYGLNVPFYIKVYMFNLNGNISCAVLLTDDNQKAFWNPVFSSVIESIKYK